MAEAFFEDPIFGWLMPEDTKRLTRLRRYFAIELRHVALARGRVWTSSDLSGAALDDPASHRFRPGSSPCWSPRSSPYHHLSADDSRPHS